MYEKYKVPEIPAMKLNDIEVFKFEISERQEELSRMRSIFRQVSIPVKAGHYTGLQDTKKKILWMSDTPQEIKMHKWLFDTIERKSQYEENLTVLINGLGLGVAIKGAFMNGATHVTVVEKNPDVIETTGQFWKEKYKDKLLIINSDSYTWKPPKATRWDVIWHDIWVNICSDNLAYMTKLHRKFGRRTNNQNSWSANELGRVR